MCAMFFTSLKNTELPNLHLFQVFGSFLHVTKAEVANYWTSKSCLHNSESLKGQIDE